MPSAEVRTTDAGWPASLVTAETASVMKPTISVNRGEIVSDVAVSAVSAAEKEKVEENEISWSWTYPSEKHILILAATGVIWVVRVVKMDGTDASEATVSTAGSPVASSWTSPVTASGFGS